MSSWSGARRGAAQSAEPLEVDRSSLSPSPPPLSETADGDSERSVVADKPYSIFTYREKWFIVSFASLAALFRWMRKYYVPFDKRSFTELSRSPLTANIYFPAIPVISREFHKSIELINLTVTVYMVTQGICASLIPPNWVPSDDSLRFGCMI